MFHHPGDSAGNKIRLDFDLFITVLINGAASMAWRMVVTGPGADAG
jgi:hypothetical protein